MTVQLEHTGNDTGDAARITAADGFTSWTWATTVATESRSALSTLLITTT